MSTTPKVAVSDVKAALTAAVGADAVTTAPEELDSYTADTYWPALAAVAAGAPLARPEIIVRVLLEFEDLVHLVEGRPCAAAARRLFPRWEGPIPQFMDGSAGIVAISR